MKKHQSSTRKHFSTRVGKLYQCTAASGVFGLLLFVYEFGNCVTSGCGTRQATNQLNWEKRWIYWTDVDTTRAGAPPAGGWFTQRQMDMTSF